VLVQRSVIAPTAALIHLDRIITCAGAERKQYDLSLLQFAPQLHNSPLIKFLQQMVVVGDRTFCIYLEGCLCQGTISPPINSHHLDG
jgi:hypothetical protein